MSRVRPIGREQECLALDAFLDELDRGSGGVMLVEGDAGTGKTTLAMWMLEEAERRGMTTLSGRSWERAQSVPYEPIVAAVGRLLRRVGPAERAELTGGLNSLATLFDGLALESTDATAEGNRARLHDALATLLSRQAAATPVLLHIDDLHWTDPASLEVVQFVCRDLPWVQLGIVATLRPAEADERPQVRNMISSLRRADVTRSIAVRSLDRAETVAVVRDRLGGVVPERLNEMVWSRSAGTPLVVHEIIEDLLSRDVLVRADRGWRLEEHDPTLPRSVSDLITNRIEALDGLTRQVLDVLAVADAPTSLDVLTAVTSQEESQVAKALAELRSRRLVTAVVELRTGTQWHPNHPIISAVVAGELDQVVLQRVHRRLFEADANASAGRRARHVIGGGDPEDPAAAVELILHAADIAWRQGAANEAIDMASHAERIYERAVAAAELDDDEALLARIDFRIGSSLTRLYRLDEAISRLLSAWNRLIDDGDLELLVDTYRYIDRAAFQAGVLAKERIDPMANAVLERVTRDGTPSQVVAVRMMQLQTAMRDQPWQRSATMEALSLATSESDDPNIEAIVTISQGWRRYAVGSDRPLTETLDELAVICRDREIVWEHRQRAALTAVDCAGALGEVDRVEEALAQLRAVHREVGETPNWREALLRGWLEVHRDGVTEVTQQLQRLGSVHRGNVLATMLEALSVRYRAGPDDALAWFDRHVGRVGTEMEVAQLNGVLARLVLARGSDHESVAAHDVLATANNGPKTAFAYGVAQAGIFDPQWLLAFAQSDAEAYKELRARYVGRADGRGLLYAAVLTADSRRVDGAEQRSLLLREAGEVCRANRLDLMAAELFLDAAEAFPSVELEPSIAWAREVAEAADAQWLVDRAVTAGALSPIRPDNSALTHREWEVAVEVSKGLTNREVASELFISIRTVTSHLDHIYTKLGFSSRDQLTEYVESAGRSRLAT